MTLLLYNTPHGLIPMYDDDFDAKKMLKVGETYKADIRLQRNLAFHKKAFALLNIAWAYLPERTQNGFRSIEGFRDYITVSAGYYEVYFNPRLRDFVEKPKSWSFSSMDNAEFSTFYERVKDVIWGIIGKYVSIEEFEKNLVDF